MRLSLDQNDGFGAGKMRVGKVFKDVSVIDRRMAVGDLTWRQPSSGANSIEEICRPAVALVLVSTGRRRPLMTVRGTHGQSLHAVRPLEGWRHVKVTGPPYGGRLRSRP